ncbi:MAG: DUF4332 domain-containing protein [Rubripirellula sp.]
MLRSFLKLFSRARQEPTIIEPSSDRVVLYARVDQPPPKNKSAVPLPAKRSASVPPASHRERLLMMNLEYTKLCSRRRCERFRAMGIVTAGDLARVDPERLGSRFGAPRKAAEVIKQYRRAIRFAASVPGMMPRDAMLLISIHRRSVRGLASESPAALHRDLERFAESTQGRQQLRGRRIPSTRRLKRWISQCETSAMRSPLQAMVA